MINQVLNQRIKIQTLNPHLIIDTIFINFMIYKASSVVVFVAVLLPTARPKVEDERGVYIVNLVC